MTLVKPKLLVTVMLFVIAVLPALTKMVSVEVLPVVLATTNVSSFVVKSVSPSPSRSSDLVAVSKSVVMLRSSSPVVRVLACRADPSGLRSVMVTDVPFLASVERFSVWLIQPAPLRSRLMMTDLPSDAVIVVVWSSSSPPPLRSVMVSVVSLVMLLYDVTPV